MNDAPVLSRGGRLKSLGVWLAGGLAVVALSASLLHGQISEADKKKRDAFLKAREEMRTVASPTPAESPTGKPKAAKKKKAKGKAAAGKSPTPRADDEDDEEAPSSGNRKKRASPSPSPAKAKKASEPNVEDDEEPTARASASPRVTPPEEDLPPPARGIPPPSSSPTEPMPSESIGAPADITIQKSGIEEEQAYEPPPPPPPKRSFWSRLFGGGRTNYRYLNRGVIDAIRRAPVRRARWKFVIVHNSGTRQGNARAFDYYHRRVRRMQNGMAYHFVVGNGTSSDDGAIEIGERWRRQINGGHVHSDYLNNISLGICLVGDFNRSRPTKAQLEATEELIKYLRERCGKSDGQTMPVRPHREMNPPQWATDCPGDAFPYGWFRRF